jgi:hypothetical protein
MQDRDAGMNSDCGSAGRLWIRCRGNSWTIACLVWVSDTAAHEVLVAVSPDMLRVHFVVTRGWYMGTCGGSARAVTATFAM